MSKEESNGEAGTQEAAASDASLKDPNAEMYENRGPKKIIRVVTVMAYLFSVSFVGILLSAYYIFLWEPPNPRLIERGRLRADPQMQLLIADAPPVDLRMGNSDFPLEKELHRTYKPLLSRMAQGANEDDVDPQEKLNLEKQERLQALLIKLRQSLVEDQRQRILARKAAISDRSDNSSIRMQNLISEYNEPKHQNISEKKTQSDNIDPPLEFTNSASTLEIENTSSRSAIFPEIETKRSHFDEESITDVNPIVDREKETRNYQRKLNDTERYPVRGSSNARRNDDITNGSNHRVFEDKVPSKVIRQSPKLDIFNDGKKLMKNETDRQSLNNERESDVHSIATSEEYVEDRASLLSSANVSVNNRQENYSGNNEVSSGNQTEQIARDEVSIDSSPRDSGFTDDDPGFHQPPNDPM